LIAYIFVAIRYPMQDIIKAFESADSEALALDLHLGKGLTVFKLLVRCIRVITTAGTLGSRGHDIKHLLLQPADGAWRDPPFASLSRRRS